MLVFHLLNQQTKNYQVSPKTEKCVNPSDPALYVCAYVKSYILEISKFRNENHDDLFISWATKNPVTKVSQARWVKTVLSLSGIYANFFFLLTHIELLLYPLYKTKEYLSMIF